MSLSSKDQMRSGSILYKLQTQIKHHLDILYDYLQFSVDSLQI